MPGEAWPERREVTESRMLVDGCLVMGKFFFFFSEAKGKMVGMYRNIF